MRERAPAFDLDATAVLAVAEQEGLSGAIGDGGWAYGPWQDHLTQFADRPWFSHGPYNDEVQQWAWSPAGVDYVLEQMAAAGARGLRGWDAICAIVHDFERPADPGREVTQAAARYPFWSEAGGS